MCCLIKRKVKDGNLTLMHIGMNGLINIKVSF